MATLEMATEKPAELPPHVTSYLEGALHMVMYGLLSFDRLPLAVQALVFYGETLGRAGRQAEIEQLNADADRYYRAACNGGFSAPLRTQGRTFAELEELRKWPAE